MINEMPRRRKLYCLVPAEKALWDSIVEIEKLPAHIKLTEAQNLVIRLLRLFQILLMESWNKWTKLKI